MKDGFPIPPGDLHLCLPKISNQDFAEKTSACAAGKFENHALIRLVAERTSDLVAITTFSITPKYIYLSPSHKKILGYNPTDLLNRFALDFLHPDDLQRLFPLLEKYVRLKSEENHPPDDLGLTTERLIFRLRDKSGGWRYLETTGDLLDDDHILFVSRDVTEKMRAEEELVKSKVLLESQIWEHTEKLAEANDALRREVSERAIKEEALKESETKYRTILESIEDGYFEVDLVGDMKFSNRALCEMTGYSPQELLGMNNRDYTEPATAKRMYKIFSRIYRTGESSKTSDYQIIRKDGTKCIVELSTSLMRDSDGSPVGFRGIVRDVTERRLARKALEESEEKYRSILQNIEDGYYEVDIAGNMVFFNDSMSRILGYSLAELKGMNNRKYMTDETAKTVYQTFNQVYRTGEPTKSLGWELVRKDGQKRHVETSVSLIRSKEGGPVGFRGIARDISEQKTLEKARERIINHLSHELGTPLSIIDGALLRMSKAVQKSDLTKIEEWIERAQRNVGRLKDLKEKIDDIISGSPVREHEKILHVIEAVLWTIEDLKDESLKENAETIREKVVKRLESFHKTEDIKTELIQLDAFLDEVCTEAIRLMKERQVEIVRVFEGGISVEMNRGILKKVCGGFLRNAIENTPDEGKIEIRLKSADRIARIDFQDFGIGITSENNKLIFGGFFHTQDTDQYASKKAYLFNAGGSGSDLLRAKVLSERFDFSVDFTSQRCRHLPTDRNQCPGKISLCAFIKEREECLSSGGSTFSLFLPLAEQF